MRRKHQFNIARAASWALGGSIAFLALTANAQFLRIGPFDFDMETSLEAIYSSNVEGQRPSEATLSREDYYFVGALKLSGHATVFPNTDVNLNTDFELEKHIIRKDLDNESAPFGSVSLQTQTRLRHSVFSANLDYKRNDETFGGFMPGDRKELQPHNEFSYGVGWAWNWQRFQASADYSYDHTRYVDEEFQDGDKDTTNLDFSFGWQISRRFQFELSHERKLQDFKYAWQQDADWEVKSKVDLRYEIFTVPSLGVMVGVEQDNTKENPNRWYPTYGIDFKSDVPLIDTPIWNLTAGGSWNYERKEEDDDEKMDLTFFAKLEQQISRTAKHHVEVTEEPVDTFGSNKETDQTTAKYIFTKDDLFIYNLTLTFDLEWKESRPIRDKKRPAEEQNLQPERTWTYETKLAHKRALSRKLSRDVEVTYKLEDSNLQSEDLDEYLVSLKFTYQF